MTSVLYAVGSGSAATAPGAWLLAGEPPTSPAVRDFWSRMEAGLDLAALRAALAETGLSDVHSCALVLAGAGLILVRGDASVVVDGADRQTVVGSRTASAWTEAALPAGTAAVILALGAGGDSVAQIPATEGVFPASTLVVRWGPSPAYDDPAEDPAAAPSVQIPVGVAPVPPPPTVAPPVVPLPPTGPPPTSEPVDEPTELLVPPAPGDDDGFFDQESLPSLPGPERLPPRPPGPPPSAPVEAGRGVLAISTGERVVLDRGAILGRSPEWRGPDERHLVTVTGSFGDVSRSHVGVSVDGDRVQVEDLGSTNGTLLAQPGAPEHLLRVGVAEVLVPGAIVTLARDVSFTYESAPR